VFFKSVNNSQSYKSSAQLCHQELVKQFQHFKLYVSHGSATRFLKNGEIYYIYFIDNLLLFPTVKEFSKSVNSWWSYRKKFDTSFFSETHCTFYATSCNSLNIRSRFQEKGMIFAF